MKSSGAYARVCLREETLTLCTVAPRLASTVRESISTLRLYVCPVTKYDLKQDNDGKTHQLNPE